jgi:hypothetical protein
LSIRQNYNFIFQQKEKGYFMADIIYSVEKTIGVLSEEKSGWRKEINLVSWNGRPSKIDIRDWAPEHEKMGKGVTLTKEEAVKLREYLDAAVESMGG